MTDSWQGLKRQMFPPYTHEVAGDPVGTAGHGLELNSVQIDVVRQAPLHHIPCHSHREHTMKLLPTPTTFILTASPNSACQSCCRRRSDRERKH